MYDAVPLNEPGKWKVVDNLGFFDIQYLAKYQITLPDIQPDIH
jgi:hypothetical protein